MGEQRAHTDGSLLDDALDRLGNKQEFHAHLLAYLLVNALLVGIWAVSGAGFFWPAFLLLGWGIGLGFHAWDAYRIGEPSERQIQREMEHLRSHRA